MDKMYVSRQLSLAMNNMITSFDVPIALIIEIEPYQDDILNDLMDLDEYKESLNRYGIMYKNYSSAGYKDPDYIYTLRIPFSFFVQTIKDSRVRNMINGLL